MPKTRTEFWKAKFDKNVENDIKNRSSLEALGWKVIVVWECEINKHFEDTMAKIVSAIKNP